jgi:hypothetical protein
LSLFSRTALPAPLWLAHAPLLEKFLFALREVELLPAVRAPDLLVCHISDPLFLYLMRAIISPAKMIAARQE